MEIKSALEILVKYKVIIEPSEDKPFNIILCKDFHLGIIRNINKAMKEYAEQFINLAAEVAEIILIETGISNYEEVNKESILELKKQLK